MDSFGPQYGQSSDFSIPSTSGSDESALYSSAFSFNPTDFQKQQVDIGQLPMPKLMKNPIVQKLVAEAMDNATYQKTLFKEMNDLRDEIATLKDEVMHHRKGNWSPQSGIAEQGLRCVPSGSISLNDSISQTAGSTVARNQTQYQRGQAKRPAKYPESILWNLEDCHKFLGIAGGSNPSWPSMEKCIRDEDGNEVPASEWRAIKKSASMLVNVHLRGLPPPLDSSAKMQSKTKRYYARYYPETWNMILEKLEDQEPLVGLCAAHWKAKHIFGNCLQAIIEDGRKKRKRTFTKDTVIGQPTLDSKSNEDLDLEQQCQTRGQKRPLEEPLVPTKQKKKVRVVKKGAVGVSTKQDDESMSTPRIPTNSHELCDNTPSTVSLIPAQTQLSTLGCHGDLSLRNSLIPDHNIVDISFIHVNTQLSSLKAELVEQFPLMQNGMNLLDAMANNPDFGGEVPSDDMTLFVRWIDTADPNSSEFSEDDTNASWGHSQFTAGGLTWSTVLMSWKNVGNCAIACQLIAAAIKTCKIARHLCYKRNIVAGAYLSDIYLEQVLDALWKIWKDAGGPVVKGKQKEPVSEVVPQSERTNPPQMDSTNPQPNTISQTDTTHMPNLQTESNLSPRTPMDSLPLPQTVAVSTNLEASSSEQTCTHNDSIPSIAVAQKELEKLLQLKGVVKEELKAWVKRSKVSVNNSAGKQPSKQEYISAILVALKTCDELAAVHQEFEKILNDRKELGKKASAKTA